ncbi:MAG: stalk domain-containing protein [Defluviitaleaceae bacterium]|nr:stalk domain-containing protein [Defluviitaleaceae bacterium]
MIKSIFFLCGICAALLISSVAVYGDIRVIVNGQPVNFPDQQPVIIDGRVLVPLRGTFEALGFDVRWYDFGVLYPGEEFDFPTRAVLSRAPNTFVFIYPGNMVFSTAGGGSFALDVPAQIIGDRVMVPLRAPLEAVGYNLTWDADTNTAIVGVGLERAEKSDDANFFAAAAQRVIPATYDMSAALQNIPYHLYAEIVGGSTFWRIDHNGVTLYACKEFVGRRGGIPIRNPARFTAYAPEGTVAVIARADPEIFGLYHWVEIPHDHEVINVLEYRSIILDREMPPALQNPLAAEGQQDWTTSYIIVHGAVSLGDLVTGIDLRGGGTRIDISHLLRRQRFYQHTIDGVTMLYRIDSPLYLGMNPVAMTPGGHNLRRIAEYTNALEYNDGMVSVLLGMHDEDGFPTWIRVGVHPNVARVLKMRSDIWVSGIERERFAQDTRHLPMAHGLPGDDIVRAWVNDWNGLTDYERYIAQYINAFRAENGLAPLEICPEFSALARYRTAYFIRNNGSGHGFGSHRTMDLANLGQNNIRGINLTAAFPSGETAREWAFAAVDTWIHSPDGHRENMLAENTVFGVGAAIADGCSVVEVYAFFGVAP